jgi:hypothetical protein
MLINVIGRQSYKVHLTYILQIYQYYTLDVESQDVVTHRE